MKLFSRAIDRYCIKNPRFGISKLMLWIVLTSALVYILMLADFTVSYLIFHPGLIMRGEVWRLITWIFLPTNSTGGMGPFFTLVALYFYYFIGSTLEREWGKAKFTIYYIFGVLLHIVYGFIVYYAFGQLVFIFPMYLNLSMFFAFAVLFPDFTVRLFFIIPIKIKWMALINGAFFVYALIEGLVMGLYIIALLPLVAILNFVLICGEELLRYVRPYAKKTSPQIIDFNKEAKRVKRDLKDKPYRHKCAVCGKTDTGYPKMDFRYCSKCEGYHCFCSEHINNHVHFR